MPPDLGPAVHYTTRVLRTGYLYLYDEARKRWQAYHVNPGGYFLPIDAGLDMPSALTKGREPCSRQGHREIASCITIPSPKLATVVWMAYSEVQWTPRMLELHAGNAAFRAQYMYKLDVQALLKALPVGEPVRPISRLAETVAEYAPDANAKQFAFSAEAWVDRVPTTESLIGACEHLLPSKGVIVALTDPTGILQDLAILAKSHEEAFLDQGDRRYHVAVNGWLQGLEDQIKDASQREWIGSALDERAYRADPMASPDINNFRRLSPFGFTATRKGFQVATSNRLAGMDTLDNLEQLADERWARYSKKLDAGERKAWQEKFADDLAAYHDTHIGPLVEGHVAWMKSLAMKNYKLSAFDDHDPESGLAYVQVVTACVQGTDDKAACQKLYNEWINGDPADPGNIILSALAYNQKAIKLELASLGNGVTWAQLAWDKFNAGVDNLFKNLAAGTPDVLGALLASIAGTVARALKEAALSPRAHAGLVAIGIAARQPVVRVEITGSKKRFRAALIREMLRLHEPKISHHKLQKAVAVELRRLEVCGVPLGGPNEPKHWLLMVNPEHVKGMPSGLSASQRAKWLAQSIKTPEQVEALNLNKYRAQVKGAGESLRRLGAQASYHAPFGFAVLGLLANVAAWDSLREDEQKAMRHKQSETHDRVTAQCVQVWGAAGEVLGKGVEKLVVPVLRGGQAVTTVLAKGVHAIGWGAGLVGALAISLLDLGRSIQEYLDGDWASSAAYGISFFLGFAATVAIAWPGVGSIVGLILVIALIGWTFIMSRIIDDDLQDWAERCVWGVLRSHRYNDFATETEELNKALRA